MIRKDKILSNPVIKGVFQNLFVSFIVDQSDGHILLYIFEIDHILKVYFPFFPVIPE